MTSRRAFLAAAGGALASAASGRFPVPLGLQIYSLRRQAAKDLPGTLALIRKLGFTELEVGGYYGRTAAEFARMLADHGLKATAMGAGWDQLLKATDEIAGQARTLGVEYVTCSAIPRKKQLTLGDAVRASDNFNRWGEALAGANLHLCYHTHGPEFVSGPDGTLLDTMAKRMDPKLANFEMDVMWVYLGRQDPPTLLERYPGRFPLMHVKDVRKGEPKTFDPGPVREEASVPIGTGEIDWLPVFRAAKKSGVRRYYIEEEHPDAVNQIQQSLRYLENLKV